MNNIFPRKYKALRTFFVSYFIYFLTIVTTELIWNVKTSFKNENDFSDRLL